MRFQSTPPRGWRPKDFITFTDQLHISIHSTARVETEHYSDVGILYQFQSTPPRGWRPMKYPSSPYVAIISIHSTARVETQASNSLGSWPRISIHSTARVETLSPYMCSRTRSFQSTPPRGWRQSITVMWVSCTNFNPLHREGGDFSQGKASRLYHVFQSTPPRGWRRLLWTYSIHSRYFNPLHREGGDGQGGVDTVLRDISIHSTARVETN